MTSNPIKLLNINDRKYLRIIQIEGPEWNKFTGYLPYSRDISVGENDFLDDELLNSLKTLFPNSFLRSNSILFYENQLQQNLNTIIGGTDKNIEIQFSPKLDFNNITPAIASRTFYAYPRNFNIRLLLNKGDQRIENINTFTLCMIEHKKLDDIIKTIKAI